MRGYRQAEHNRATAKTANSKKKRKKYKNAYGFSTAKMESD
jgi:hypothetical protein